MGYTEKSSWLLLLAGFALVFVWSALSLAHAYERSLARMNDSFSQGLMIVDRLGAVLDALDRLSTDEQAFLSTGEARFQDGVVESAEALTIDIGMLDALAAEGKFRRANLAILSRCVDRALNLVGESDAVRQDHGAQAALAYFDSRENTLAEAKLRANQLRSETVRRLSDRVRSTRRPKTLLHEVLDNAPACIALQRGVSAIHLARNPQPSKLR
jgi:CHASE3 domain sensor protein